MDRRKFIKILGAAGVASALPVKFNPLKGLKGLEANQAWAVQYSPPLQKFLPSQYLPMVPGSTSPYQFAAGVPDPVSQFAFNPAVGSDLYRLTVRQFTQQLHPDPPQGHQTVGLLQYRRSRRSNAPRRPDHRHQGQAGAHPVDQRVAPPAHPAGGHHHSRGEL